MPERNRPPGAGQGPNCWGCVHFGVSWDPGAPYLCKTMGFKTSVMPAIAVLRADGRPCGSFQPKAAGSRARVLRA